MTVLVTGATGHLGGLLVSRLLAEGRSVRVLTRRPFLAASRLESTVAIHEWHPAVACAPRDALDGVEAVIHLMGTPLATASEPGAGSIRTSRCEATERLAAGFGRRRWRLIVASVVPVSTDSQAVLSDVTAGADPGTAFEQAVRAAETAATSAQTNGVSVAIVRLGLLAEPGGAFGPLVRMAAAGLLPVIADSLIPVIDPDDAAAMLAGLVDRTDIEGSLNGVCPEPLRGSDLVQLLAAAGRFPVRIPAPRWLVARRTGGLASLLYNRARIVPQRLLDMGAGFQNSDAKASATRAIAAILADRAAHRFKWPWKMPVSKTSLAANGE